MFSYGKTVIDSLGNGKFVMLNDDINREDIITAYEAHRHYYFGDYDVEFTKKALDEIQNAIEEEFLRQEESCQASYATANS